MTFRIWAAFLLFPTFLLGQAKITGTCPDWIGQVVDLSYTTNPISGSKILLDVDTVDASGQFELVSELDEIQQVWIRINRFKANLFVEPKSNYFLEIPSSPEFPLIAQWRPGNFEYIFIDLNPNDVSAQIIEFDEAYFTFFSNNARFMGTQTMKNKVKEFEAELTTSESEFVKNYVDYSLAEMKLTAGFPRNELFQSHVEAKPLDYSNPAFYSFFSVFYSDAFDRYDARSGEPSLANQSRSGLSYSKLDSVLSEDEFLNDKELRQWVMIKSIKDCLYLNSYSGENFSEILTEIEKAAANVNIATAAKEIREDYASKTNPEILSLLPQLKEKEILDKPTLLVVSSPESLERKREASVINSLTKTYGEFFNVAEVSLGVKSPTETKWPILKASSEEEFMDKLAIYRIPWYGWIETDGSIELDIQKPSLKLEERLFSIRAKEREKNKIKVGQ
ncbi:MAG: hypothetical protein AAGC47_11295 [Bacteroidota bacterium]